MYLVDTNIFLEVLLAQEKREPCKRFLDANLGNLYISDFSLHSIGVILFRTGREDVFQKFSIDVIPKVEIVALPKESYKDLAGAKKDLRLDFDDAYHFKLAEGYSLRVVTMDRDFERVSDKVEVTFLKGLT